MADSLTFINSLREKSKELELEWNTFSRQIFHFLKSLQLQQHYMGGSPTYFKCVDDVARFQDSYLTDGSSERQA